MLNVFMKRDDASRTVNSEPAMRLATARPNLIALSPCGVGVLVGEDSDAQCSARKILISKGGSKAVEAVGNDVVSEEGKGDVLTLIQV